VFLASQGIRVTGFDSSAIAVDTARKRLDTLKGVENLRQPQMLLHDLRSGLPADTGTIDFISDIFVYKHQLSSGERATYRAEMARVLSPNGRILISLAALDDGYYCACPDYSPPGVDIVSNPRTVLDVPIMIGSVLFSLDQLVAEMLDRFVLEMSWHKLKPGVMHGGTYVRSTLATMWRRADHN
jgi:SAM-dependent methyltransferase